MGWLLGETWIWVLLSFLLGLLLTLWLILRKVEVTTLGTGASRGAGLAAGAGLGAAGVGAAGAATGLAGRVTTPTAEAPSVEAPSADVPSFDASVDAPAVDAPAVDAPAVETPSVETPSVETPPAPAVAAPGPSLDKPRAAADVDAGIDTGDTGLDGNIDGNIDGGAADAAVDSPLDAPAEVPAEVPADDVDAGAAAETPATTETAEVAGFAAVPAAGAFGEGSADPLDDGASPHESYTIKGNADSMLFHPPESPYYSRTRAEVWFDSEDRARTAGFTRWNERDTDTTQVAGLAALPAAGAFGEGSADPLDDGASPHESYTIKGNADSMLFHPPESPYYSRTRAEVWFDSEDRARTAGFTRWNERDTDTTQVAGLAALPAAGAFGEGSADPLDDGASPHESYTIKGNADSMLFHPPESPYYSRTRAEVWFDSEDRARTAGFTRWNEK